MNLTRVAEWMEGGPPPADEELRSLERELEELERKRIERAAPESRKEIALHLYISEARRLRGDLAGHAAAYSRWKELCEKRATLERKAPVRGLRRAQPDALDSGLEKGTPPSSSAAFGLVDGGTPPLRLYYRSTCTTVPHRVILLGCTFGSVDFFIPPAPGVARQHARIRFVEGSYTIEDTGGTALGIYYAGKHDEASPEIPPAKEDRDPPGFRVQERLIEDRDVFYIGNQAIWFSFASKARFWLHDPKGILRDLGRLFSTVEEAAAMYRYILAHGRVIAANQAEHSNSGKQHIDVFEPYEYATFFSLFLEEREGADVSSRYAEVLDLSPCRTRYGEAIQAGRKGAIDDGWASARLRARDIEVVASDRYEDLKPGDVGVNVPVA